MNYIVLWKDARLFTGKNPIGTTIHQHPVIQAVIAKDGMFKTKLLQNDTWVSKKGLIIKPNHEHQCDATNIPIFSLEIDPDTDLGDWILSTILKEQPTLSYPSKKMGSFDFNLIRKLIDQKDWEGLYEHITETFRFKNEKKRHQTEQRIQQILNFIHAHVNETLSTEKLSEIAFLSESRLLHLFKEQMGLPIRNYILWFRIRVAIESVIEGASLTEAAYEAGFSDQAHFSRTCKKMIGVTPSILTKNSKFVQVYFSS